MSDRIVIDGTCSLTSNIDGQAGIFYNVGGEAPVYQTKTATPTDQTQNITADAGYNALSKVVVEPIPSEYIVPSGEITIGGNGIVNVKEYETADVGVYPVLQSKSATPAEQPQTIEADQEYYGLSSVSVGAIPSEYIVPSGTISITENGTVDVSSYASAEVNVSGGGGYEETLVWENSDRTQAFAAQTVDSTDLWGTYDYIKIIVSPTTTSAARNFSTVIVPTTNYSRYASINHNDVYTRGVMFTSVQTIVFRNCYQNQQTATKNNYCIPVAIYGIKAT